MFDFNDINIENSVADTIDYNLMALRCIMKNIKYPDSMNGIYGTVVRDEQTNELVVNMPYNSNYYIWQLFANTYIFYNDIVKLADSFSMNKRRDVVFDLSFIDMSNYVADHYNRYKKYCISKGIKNIPGIAEMFCKMLDIFLTKIRYTGIWRKNEQQQYRFISTITSGRHDVRLLNKRENVIKIISYIAAQPKHKFNILLSNNVINILMGILDEHNIGTPEGGYNIKTLTLKNFCDITYKAMIKANKSKKAKK